LTTEDALRMLPTSHEEVEHQAQLVRVCGARFDAARSAHVTSAAGTDLHLLLGQWQTRLHLGIAPPGGLQVLPAGQITRVPNDNSANGVVVIDRSIADGDYRALTEPVILHVKSGKVVSIEGGLEAEKTRLFLERLDDERVYHLTELAIGTNPRCRFAGVGGPAEDTHTWGTVSLALGCDVHIGGGVPGPVHIDMTMLSPSLALDGIEIVRQGRLLVDTP
jgi:2,5-dihydroxypyridine 5,6-dioxygenase